MEPDWEVPGITVEVAVGCEDIQVESAGHRTNEQVRVCSRDAASLTKIEHSSGLFIIAGEKG